MFRKDRYFNTIILNNIVEGEIFAPCFHTIPCYFKELFLLDGKKANLEENDVARRNTITTLMSDWGLVEIQNNEEAKPLAPLRQIKIIPFKEKDQWELCPKYNIGNK